MRLQRLSESIYGILGGEREPNTGFVLGRNGILVIDSTFTPYHATQVLKYIRSISQKPIKYVFNSHFHSDHTFGNQVFSAKVIATKECRETMRSMLETGWSRESVGEWLDDNPQWKGPMADLNVTLPDVVFEGEYEIDLGNQKVILRHMGGHTEGSSIAWIPSSKVLFSGDLMFKGRYPYTNDANLTVWLAALKTLEQMDFEALVPGHGSLCDKEDLKHLIRYFENLLEKCKEFIQKGLSLTEIQGRKEFLKYAKRNVDLHQENIKKAYTELTQGEGIEE
jgi:glyoxylase-like metal-dependent hydrolase (beta-lactamase superfamily II)